MKVQPVKSCFKLSSDTIRNIEKRTKLSYKEMISMDPQDVRELMIKRGAIKKANILNNFFARIYKYIGEKFGPAEEKRPYIYTDVD